MIKKTTISVVVALLLLGGTFQPVNAGEMTLSQMIELFISVGIITPDKVVAARAIAANSGAMVNVAPANTIARTTGGGGGGGGGSRSVPIVPVAPIVAAVAAQSVSSETVTAEIAAPVIAFKNTKNAIFEDSFVAAMPTVINEASTSTATSTFCGPLTRDLILGSSGDDVVFLQTELGVAPATGYFGTTTEAAVKKFETDHGLPAFGFMNSKTKDVFNSIYGCNPDATRARPTVLLVSEPTITKMVAFSGTTTLDAIGTTTVRATFMLRITATGSDFTFNKGGTSTSAIKSSSVSVYRNFGKINVPVNIDYSYIAGGVTYNSDGSFTLHQNNTVVFPVSVEFQVPARFVSNESNYRVSLDYISWIRTSNMMNDFTSLYSYNALSHWISPAIMAVNPIFPAVETSLTILTPNGGEILTPGQTYRITWDSKNIDTVTILPQCEIPCSLEYIAEYIENVGYYDWKVDSLTNTNQGYKIKVLGFNSKAVLTPRDYSDNYFYIQATGTPAFHSADTNRDLRINQSEFDRVSELYNSRAGTVRTGTYHMSTTTIDGYELGSGLIVNYHTADSNKDGNISLFELTRVIELKNASGGYRVQAGTEDGFAPVYETTTVDLTPSIKIISPNGGEKFTGGQTVDIHWISLNIPVGRPVSIELYRKSVNPDGSITRRGIGLVADQIANTGVYSWTIPTYFSEASNYSIMINGSVTGEEGSGFADNSDSTFSISGGKPIVIEFSSPTVSEGDTLRVYADTTKSQYPNSEFAIFALESLDGTAYIASNYTYKKDNFGRWYQDFAISSTTKQGTWVVRLVGTFANNAVQQYFNYGFDIDASFEVVPRNIVTVTCTDSDGGTNLDVAGLTDGRVNGSGSYFTDISVSTNGSMCSGDGCTSVAEGVCLNGAVTNQLHLCPSGYSVGGVCSAKHQVSTTTPVVIFENNTGGNVIITNIDTVQIPETVEQTEIIEIYQVVPEVDIIQVSEPVLEVTQEPETVYLPEMVIQESISEPQQSIETPVESNTMAPEMAEAQE